MYMCVLILIPYCNLFLWGYSVGLFSLIGHNKIWCWMHQGIMSLCPTVSALPAVKKKWRMTVQAATQCCVHQWARKRRKTGTLCSVLVHICIVIQSLTHTTHCAWHNHLLHLAGFDPSELFYGNNSVFCQRHHPHLDWGDSGGKVSHLTWRIRTRR